MVRPKESGCLPTDVNNLASEWDKTESIRARIRSGGDLVDENTKASCTVKTIKKNATVLEPIAKRMADQLWKLPAVDPLRQQVRDLYFMNNQTASEDSIIRAGWQIREHLSKLKRKAHRCEVSQDRPKEFDVRFHSEQSYVCVCVRALP